MKINLREIWMVISVLLALCIYVVIVINLQYKLCSDSDFAKTLVNTRIEIITISGVLAGIIMAYLTSKVHQIRNEKISKMPDLYDLTQKLHRFRAIVDKLLQSNLWVDGLKSFIKNHKEVSFFDIQSDTPSQKTLNFFKENKYGDTTYLYLELKSFIDDDSTPFDMTLYSEFDVPKLYNSKILGLWLGYYCGHGLWYYFDNKYASYRGDLNLNNVCKVLQDQIKTFAIQIDKERYGKFDFSPELLAQLGTQINDDIIPKLYRLHLEIESKLPPIINYLFCIFVFLIVFGVLFPLLSKIFALPPAFDIISISAVVSLCLYLVISFYDFLRNETEINNNI